MLTGQKRKYAHARAAGQCKKDAAQTASPGTAEKSAKVMASRWERDAEVQAYMRKLGFTPEVGTLRKKPPEPKQPLPATAPAAGPTYLDEPVTFDDPVDYMRHVMNDANEDPKLRLDAAKAWDASNRAKVQAKGKKGEKEERAQKAANRFAAPAPPGLKRVK